MPLSMHSEFTLSFQTPITSWSMTHMCICPRNSSTTRRICWASSAAGTRPSWIDSIQRRLWCLETWAKRSEKTAALKRAPTWDAFCDYEMTTSKRPLRVLECRDFWGFYIYTYATFYLHYKHEIINLTHRELIDIPTVLNCDYMLDKYNDVV